MFIRVKPILEHATEECRQNNIELSVGFTTNSYLLTEEMMDYLQEREVSFQITVDGAREYHNKTRFTRSGKGSYDTIIENIDTLSQRGFAVNMRINYTHENLYSIADILADIEHFSADQKEKITVDMQRVWQERPVNDEEKEELTRLIQAYRDKGFYVS